MKSIKEFFNRHVLPLSRKAERGEFFYLDSSFDTEKCSYFSDPVYPQFHNLCTVPSNSETELESYLYEFWTDDLYLAGFIPDLVKLAFILKKENEDQNPEISPFLYVMY